MTVRRRVHIAVVVLLAIITLGHELIHKYLMGGREPTHSVETVTQSDIETTEGQR